MTMTLNRNSTRLSYPYSQVARERTTPEKIRYVTLLVAGLLSRQIHLPDPIKKQIKDQKFAAQFSKRDSQEKKMNALYLLMN